MQLIYAALLLHGAGKEINEDNVKKIVEAVGAKVDDAQIKALVAALDGVNIEEVIEKAAMPVAQVAAPVATKGVKEEKKEEESEEDKEKKAEEAASGLSSLFG